MRELIQEDYAAAAKAINSAEYQKTQIKEKVLDPKERAVHDSMEKQKEQFATQSAHAKLTENQKEKKEDDLLMTSDRMRFSVKSEDQRLIMKKEPKVFNVVREKTNELKLGGPAQSN